MSPLPAQPVLLVVTGGPFSGKTTLVRALADAGHPTVAEAAMDVIRDLNDRWGAREQRRWRRSHLAEFQRMVLDLQLARERRLPSNGPVFLDRGIADGIAYFRHAGLEPPAHLVQTARSRPYRHAFVLDTLEDFQGRRDSGRSSSRDDSVRLAQLLAEVYEQMDVPVTRIRCAPVPERVRAILERVAP